MSGPRLADVFSLVSSQLRFHPPLPTSSFSGQTVIVTGSNTGLGREVVKHLVRLGAAKVILGVRDLAKGEAAVKYVEGETGRSKCMEVWQLDMANFASVKAFAKRAETLERLDAVVANAGIWPTKFEMAEGHETTITVNVISTFLLVHLLLPKLRSTAAETRGTTRVTVLTSTLHKFAKFPAQHTKGSIFEELKRPVKDFDGRYNDSKLLEVLYGQRLAVTLESQVCLNMVCPGYCVSNLVTAQGAGAKMTERIMARSTDEGARIIVDAVVAEKVDGRQGAFVSDMKQKKSAAWIDSKEGKETSERVWTELNDILNGVAPELSL